jgi:gliding motility-associated-like protein
MLIPAYTKASQYRWIINHGEAIYNELSTTHEFSSSGEHHIRLEIEKNPGTGFTEFSEKTICVCASAEVKIEYDLFTPNGDYFSKVFDPMIHSRNIIPVRLLIFEKSSGKQIFEGLNENAKWDGTGEFGQQFPASQYFYQFSSTDLCGKKLVDKTGFIELER